MRWLRSTWPFCSGQRDLVYRKREHTRRSQIRVRAAPYPSSCRACSTSRTTSSGIRRFFCAGYRGTSPVISVGAPPVTPLPGGLPVQAEVSTGGQHAVLSRHGTFLFRRLSSTRGPIPKVDFSLRTACD